jgi:hypothetical protein
MIPLWMFPLAIATGNTFVLKPSERVPSCAQRLVELMWVPLGLRVVGCGWRVKGLGVFMRETSPRVHVGALRFGELSI